MEHAFQSTHSVGSGTRHHHPAALIPCISIHPLRGEWDALKIVTVVAFSISIHPLRGEWDRGEQTHDLFIGHFNPPTPWGVGRVFRLVTGMVCDFNPPTPWGVGRLPPP